MKTLTIALLLIANIAFATEYDRHDYEHKYKGLNTSIQGNDFLALCAKSEIHPTFTRSEWQGGIGGCTDLHGGALSFGAAKRIDNNVLFNMTVTPVDSEDREVYIGAGFNFVF